MTEFLLLHRYPRAQRLLAALVYAVAILAARPVLAHQEHDAPAAQSEGAHAVTGEAHGEDAAHEEGWGATIAKVVNFAALVAILVYFLRAPIVQYLAGRHDTIRKDLVEAKATRDAAETQLAAVRARLAALPAELQALRDRGRADLAGEHVRLQAATAREREHLVERTRREIDLQFRVARRALTTHAAELTASLARTRIEQSITPEDQARLVDRYAAEVHW